MPTFKELQKELKEVEYKIIAAGGEDKEDEYETLTALVKEKATNVALVLNNKVIDKQIKYIDEKIKEAMELKRALQNRKEFLERELNYYLGNDVLVIEDMTKKYVKASYSVRHEVDKSKLEDKDKLYKITIRKVPHEDFITIINLLEENYSGNYSYDLDVGVKDLPEGHEALEERIRPTIKITKTKPKQ